MSLSSPDVSLFFLIVVAALLYSSVGHGGASGYLASMALFGLAPEVMKPTALALNVLVSAIGTVRFARAGFFRWATFWPFAVASIPFAFLGGATSVPPGLFRPALGAVLWFAAARLFLHREGRPDALSRPPPVPLAMATGAVLGWVSGLIGVGGGIFLSPLLLVAGWARMRETAAVSAAFILVNSLAGLAGLLGNTGKLPSALPLWATGAILGGMIGSELGSRRLAPLAIRRLLALVLVVAGAKLLLPR